MLFGGFERDRDTKANSPQEAPMVHGELFVDTDTDKSMDAFHQRQTHLRRHTLLQGGVHLLLQLRADPTHHVHLKNLSVEVYVSTILQFEKPNLII